MSPVFMSVVIPTYNRRDVLLRTLSSVFAQDFRKDSRHSRGLGTT